MRFFVLLLVVTLPIVVCAQDSLRLKADRLEQQLPAFKADEKVEALRWLAGYYTHTNADKAIQLYRDAIAEGEIIQYGKLNALHTAQIFCFVIVGQYDSAEVHVNKALTLTSEEDPLRSTIFMNAGSLYLRAGKYSTALNNYHKAQEIAEKSANENQLMRIYVNTAVVYEMLNDYKKAIKFDSLGYNLAIKLKSHASANVALSNLGEHLQLSGMLTEALAVFKQAEKNALNAAGAQYALALIYSNMADIKLKMEKPDSAVYYASKALRLFEEQNSQSHIDGLHRILSRAELKRGNTLKAEQYAQLAYTSGTERKVATEIKAAAYLLMKINLQKNNLKAAERYEREYLSLTDSLEKENQAKAVIELQTKYDTEKKEKENELLKRGQELQRAQLARQQSITVYVTIVLALVIILLALAYRSYRQKQRANARLHQQGENIKQQNALLQEALNELQATQKQLIHSEKMASLGQMTAGIAHEINNPLTFIHTGADELNHSLSQLNRLLAIYDLLRADNYQEHIQKINQVKEEINYTHLLTQLQDNIKAIKIGSHRTSAIIASLQRFSRKGEEGFVKKDIAEIIDETLLLIQGQIKDKIHVDRDYKPGTMLECLPAELGQVIMNLLLNAIQAMNQSGRITIQVKHIGTRVVINVTDTGSGIPQDIISKIFDPFFTTKDVGKGTGLGLSVTHGIVKNHGGEITVKSVVNEGTTFTIILPVKHLV
ncbi:MAG: tetratricopeptide repeat protein [Cyclobacteriaceae bacterium]|nr:tetratricopeptide repeat protein [Cyclobacteriaceae bacterium]